MQEHRNLFLGGRWAASQGGTVRTVISPATEEVIGRVVLQGSGVFQTYLGSSGHALLWG
jgi:acyl-CoA reductase-like NAD-dependent aldehyde dehydrogenase